MFYQILRTATKCNYVLTETIIENAPKIVVTNDNNFPEIVNRLITFELNDEVKIEDVVISTFSQETIKDKKYVVNREERSYSSAKNLLKYKSPKQVELKIGKQSIFYIKCLESRCLMKLNEDLQNIHEDLRAVSIKNDIRQIFQSLENEDLRSSFVDEEFYEKLFKDKICGDETIKREIYLKTSQTFIEFFKRGVHAVITNKYKDEILYITDDISEDRSIIMNEKIYKHMLQMNTDFWPLVEEFLQKEYKNNGFQFLEDKETGEDFVLRITNSVFRSIVDRRGEQKTKGYIYSLISKQTPLKTLKDDYTKRIFLTTLVRNVFESMNLIALIDSIRISYTSLVNNILERLRAPLEPYSAIHNFKAFQAKIEEYKNISQQNHSEKIKNAINNIEKSVESYLNLNRNFEDETRIFNIIKDESIAFNFKIIFKDSNDKIQTIVSKYYTFKDESLHEIDEIPSISLPKSTEDLKKKTGILKSPWFYICILGFLTVVSGFIFYFIARDK